MGRSNDHLGVPESESRNRLRSALPLPRVLGEECGLWLCPCDSPSEATSPADRRDSAQLRGVAGLGEHRVRRRQLRAWDAEDRVGEDALLPMQHLVLAEPLTERVVALAGGSC
jgi:hypothetical protein